MGADTRLRKYGVEATIDFEVYEVDGVDLRVDWTPANADCEIMKDGGASTACDNTATDEGSTYSIVLTATEMEAARLVLKVVDAATKAFLDRVVVIETYGNASAQHAVDLDDGVRAGLTALPNAAANAAGGLVISAAGALAMDTQLANTHEVTAARMGALTDWINDGRLDVILDAIYDQTLGLSHGSAGISTPPKAAPDGFVITEGASEAQTEDVTHALDGITHDIEDAAPNTDVYYEFTVGTEGVPILVSWHGYVNSQGDSYAVYGYDFGNTAWVQIGSISGANGTTIMTEDFTLTTNLVEAGVGTVRVRFYSTDGTKLATDQILMEYTAVISTAGIADAVHDEATSGHVDPGSFGKLAIDTDVNAARLTAVRAAVLTDWIDAGRLDVILDAIPTTAMRGTDSAALASVCTEARLQALTDWLNGGRLDLLLDAIPTTAMRGTDNAATAAKLLAYTQLLARSDAAIATDNATELTEINADGGSGAGDFDNAADAQEAIQVLIAALANYDPTTADTIETGFSDRQALRLIATGVCGLLSGAGTVTETLKGLDKSTSRMVATVDADGNRSAITYTKGT